MDNKKKGYVKRVNFMCTLSALLALILFLGFLHKRTLFRFEYPLDTEAVGQYGDFIGGVVGTIISAVLFISPSSCNVKNLKAMLWSTKRNS